MSDSDSSNCTPPSGSRFTENITDVVYISLPIPSSATFSCHICTTVGQKLSTHNSLKKHFRATHKGTVVVRFECHICQFELPSVRSYAAHHAEIHSRRPVSPPSTTPGTPQVPPISSEAIDCFLAAARRQSISEALPPDPSTVAPIPPTAAPILLDTRPMHPHPPGLLINFGPRELLPPLSASLSEVPSDFPPPPPEPDPPDGNGSLWSWTGRTNVLYDVLDHPVVSGCWERGGGGRCYRPRSNPPIVTEEIRIARQLLLPSAVSVPSPEMPQNSVAPVLAQPPSPLATPGLRNTTHTPPTGSLHVFGAPGARGLVGAEISHLSTVSDPVHSPSMPDAPPWNRDAGHSDLPRRPGTRLSTSPLSAQPPGLDRPYSSSSERVLPSLLSEIPPWNVGAGHFDIPQRSARLANLSHHPIPLRVPREITREGQSRRCAPSTSTTSVHSGHILSFGEPLRSPPLPDETPLHTAAGYFNLPQLGPSSRPLTQQHQPTPCHVQQYEDMVNPRVMTAHQPPPPNEADFAAEPLPNGADDVADPPDDDGLPPPPKLTDQQRQWNATFHSLLQTDLEGLSALSQEIATAAAERKDAAPPDQSRDAVPTQRGTRRAPPRRQQYNPQDASEIQKLYRIDRNKAMTHILDEPSPYCAADPAAIEAHLSTIFSGTDHPWSDPPPCVPEFTQTTTPEELTFLTAPITPREVANRLQRMKNTAPGPDGARYAGLRRADPGCHTLALIYSRCLAQAQVPLAWKESTTVLIYKAGDRDNLNNWRPLSLGNTIAKLYSGVLADRVSRWAEEGKRISPQQKGFTRHDGCLEHNFILQSAINQARRTGQELCVAWLDLANAFPSVPHNHIFGTLSLLGLPAELIAVIRDLYTDTTTRGMTSTGLTAPIPLSAGVKQGCPLSPVVFDLAMEPIIRAVVALKPLSFKLGLIDQSTLAFADDLSLLAKNDVALQRQLDVASETADWCGLTFKPSKCATLHILNRETVDSVFTIDENPLAVLGEGQHYRHLGVPTGFRNKQTPEESLAKIGTDLDLLDASLLAPWQKIDAVVTFLVPRLDFILRGADVRVKPLSKLDKTMKKCVKKWMNLPQRASAEVVFIPSPLGGAGILPFSDMRNVCAVTHGYRLLTCPDDSVRETAWDTLKTAVQLKIRHVPTMDDVASYLNGATDGEMANTNGDVPSLWSRVRICTRALRRTADIQWWWCATRGEMQLIVPRPDKEPNQARAHPAARRQVCSLLKTALRAAYLQRLLKKPDQGKVYSVTSLRSESNHMMKSGLYTRFADWRFLHRARLDTMPLNGTRRFGNGSKRCRRCNNILESLPHVLSHCKYVSRPRALRHHATVHRLAKGTPAIAGTTSEDRKIPGTSCQLRPDLVVTNALTRSISIIDVAVVFENKYEAFQLARSGKIQKYSLLADELRSQGWDVYLNAFIVGALGGWDPDNETVIRQLRISKSYAKLMKKLIISDTIRWSRDIYVEFISGKRQYQEVAPTNPIPAHPRCDPARIEQPGEE